ncbi:MAG: TonB-dependent receptor [Cyclobacteriaceae bacterium]
MSRVPLLLLLVLSLTLRAQSPLNIKLNSGYQGKSLNEVLVDLESKEQVRFFYLTAWIQPIVVKADVQGKTLQQLLMTVFENTDLSFYELNGRSVVIVRDPAREMLHQDLLTTAFKESRKPEKIELGNKEQFRPGTRVKLSGIVKDAKTNEPVSGATILISDLNAGVVTDANGRFEAEMFSGAHVVSVNYINYDEKIIDLNAYIDGEIAVSLEETPVLLEEVVVVDRASTEVTTARIGQSKISIQEIRRLPALLGEVDIVKQIQALPGVTTAGEAASGFNVRGGSVDQNLVLYDGVPVFNTSHAFGFFSAFNASAIRSVNFYRGGIPAEFGGRASSVLDLTSAEGNSTKWQGGGGIGLLSAQLQVNGPIIKNKTSVAASVRSTYSDWLLNSIRTNYSDLTDAEVSFYDATVKLSHRFSDKARIAASWYGSSDGFRISGDSTYSWKNQVFSLRFDKTITNSLQGSLSAGMGSYEYTVTNIAPASGFDLSYRITYPTLKADFTWQPLSSQKFSFGYQGTWYGFDPGRLIPTSESNTSQIIMPEQQSAEHALYLSDAITVGEKLFLEAGVRYSWFDELGPRDVNQYVPGKPLEMINYTGVTSYGKKEKISTWNGLEPRLSARLSFNENASIKAGFNRAYQYLHLITNTTAVTPVDIWLPSGTYFKPQYADQISLGYYQLRKEKKWEGFIEGFYKNMYNVLEFKDGAQLILNDKLETDLLQGIGKAYGAEFSFTRNAGRLQGTASYTWSRSLRTVDGPTEREKINKGKEYASNFDQPHTVTVQWRYGISRRIFFTGNFSFRSGRPVSAPFAGYVIDNISIGNFSERNQYRIPDYHRLDLGVVLEGGHRRNKRISGSWSLSVINLYGRRNPYTVFFKGQPNGIFNAYTISVIGTMIPSVSYNFKF